jgi:hypothetical protein
MAGEGEVDEQKIDYKLRLQRIHFEHPLSFLNGKLQAHIALVKAFK